MSTVVKDLGAVSAYAYAVEKGYTGTEAEFAELMADYSEVGQRAEDAADSALESKTAAQTAATTATTKASEATTAATTATTKAAEAQADADAAALDASQALSAASTATTKATEATTAAATATSAATTATTAKDDAVSAKTAAQTAQTGAETAAASVSASAAQIATNAEDISQLKSDLNAKFQKVIGKNLVDTSKTVTGAIQSNGMVATNGTWATYKTSDYIELEENTDYSYACYLESTLAVKSSARKVLLLYNASKEPVSASYVSATSVDNVTFNSGTTYKYARVSYNHDVEVIPQFEEGTTATSYQAYTSSDYLLTKLGTTPMSQIVEKYDGLFNAVMPFPLDLHDSITDVVGVLYSNGTINTGGTSYHTSDYIRVLNGYKYVFDHLRNIAYYDDSKAFVSFIDNPSNAKYTYSATADGYIRFSYSNSAVSTAVTVIFDGTYTKKIDEKIDLSIRQKDTVKDIVEETSGNILYGKKWVVCGDSFTNGATETTIATGKYAGKRYVYPYLIGNRNNMEIVQFFGGGRTFAFPAVPDDFVNSLCCSTETFYYQNIPADADYITIYLGINDEHHAPSSSGGDGEDNTGEIPIGTVDDNTVNTYLGAWNVVLTWLITNRPNAHIGMLVTNGNQSKDEYRQGQIAIAEKYGIPYIDMNGDARTPAMIRTSNPNIPSAVKQALIQKWAVDPSSNTHPNDDAHLFESTFIENFLRSI